MSNNWITDRPPTVNDAHCGFVWITTKRGDVFREIWKDVCDQPWMPITPPKPYVKTKRYVIQCYGDSVFVGPAGYWCVYDTIRNASVSDFMPREAAERIAAAYEEVMP